MVGKRGLLLGIGFIAVGFAVVPVTRLPLVTGKWVSPNSAQTEVGSFPANMILSPDGRFVLVTNTGFREQLSVLDSRDGQLVSKLDFNGEKAQLYYGLASIRQADETTLVAVSRGGEDKVDLYSLSDSGQLTLVKQLSLPPKSNSAKLPRHAAGVAFSPDGQAVFVVANQSFRENGFRGSLCRLPIDGSAATEASTEGFPMQVTAAKTGNVFVSNEGGEGLTVLTPTGQTAQVRTGTAPIGMAFSPDEKLLYVANSLSDDVSVVDSDSQRVVKTILLRPSGLRGRPGISPLGVALSPDGQTLFAALADMNAVAVASTRTGKLLGYLPAGWYPTSLVVSPDGKNLFVANAKGVEVRHPNQKDVGDRGTYGPNLIEGTVQRIELATVMASLPSSTREVLANNSISTPPPALKNPGIEHVFYVIKENRTYDQVLSDLPRGNNDTSVLMFGREVTPNQHALASRFAQLDNFYCTAEVSADGWNWSTSGMASPYVERNTFVNYSGRGRNYDFEGQVNGDPRDLRGERDPAAPAGGYLWDAAIRSGVSLRNYGFFETFAKEAPNGKPNPDEVADNVPSKRALQSRTCLDFRRFDLAFADSEAWVKYGLTPPSKQMTAYGSKKDPSRISTWKREFAAQLKANQVPGLTMLRLGRDHTSGTSPDQYSPRAMVADNDYAVGQLVDEISHSPIWAHSAIFVVEDDAQDGQDHVDSHRSTCYVISPFVPRARLSSEFVNTDTVIRTIADLLHIHPWNQYVAGTKGFDFLSSGPENLEPFNAQLPRREIVGEINTKNAYRAMDSERLISRFEEETLPDLQLNDILRGALLHHR